MPRSSIKSKSQELCEWRSLRHVHIACRRLTSFFCSLTATNESLEEKIEDLRKQLDELNREVEIERRKNERLQIEQQTRKEELFVATTNNARTQRHSDASDKDVLNSNSNDSEVQLIEISRATLNFNHFTLFLSLSLFSRLQSNDRSNITTVLHQPIFTTTICGEQTMGIDEVDRRFAEHCDNEEIINIITDLDGTKRQLVVERQRVTELEDQLSSLSECLIYDYILPQWGSFYQLILFPIVQDNRDLQNRIAQSITADVGEMRSMHDELSILEESGYVLSRFGGVDFF